MKGNMSVKENSYRLGKYSLEEYLHDDRWIGEYSLDDLSLLSDCCPDLLEEFREAGLSGWRFGVRIWY